MNRVAIFMVSTQPVLGSTAAATMTSTSAAAATAGAGGSMRPATQVLIELLEALATLMGVEVTPDTEERHKLYVARLRDDTAQAKAVRVVTTNRIIRGINSNNRLVIGVTRSR